MNPTSLVFGLAICASFAPGALRAADEPPAAPSPATMPSTLPAGPDLGRRVTATLLDFNDALRRKDFAAFRQRAASPLAAKMSAAQMLAAFNSLAAQGADLSPLKDVAPAFDEPPTLTDAGEWVVKGRYPTTPFAVRFAVKYFAEQGEWKVLTLEVALEKMLPPPRDEVTALVRRTLADFAAAVKAKDFAPFTATASAPFRDQFPPRQLRQTFSDITDKEVDLTPPAAAGLTFETPPAIEAGPILVAEGHYRAGALAVRFRLTYAPDDGGWKLRGIEVNVKKVGGV